MKIEPTGCFWVLVAAIVIGAISSFFPSDESRRDAEEKSLIAQEEKLNDKCRDTWKTATEGKQACDSRDEISLKLRTLGWCYGHDGQIEADRKWEECQTAPQQTAAETPPKKADDDAVQFDPDAARGKEMLEEVYNTARSCMYDIAKVQLMTGNKSRSDILTKMLNVCGNQYLAGIVAFHSTKWGAKQGDATPEQIDLFLRTLANRELDLASQQ